jgi:ATP-dependent DNA ligase
MQSFQFPSSSNPNKQYTTVVNDDGKLTCDCPGWTVRRGDQPRQCKHTKSLAKDKPIAVKGEYVYLGAAPAAPVSIPALPTSDRPPAPMLASAITDLVTGTAFDAQYSGWLMEEKYDGHRVQVVVKERTVRAWSRPRAGEVALERSLPSPVSQAFLRLPDGIYDGELWLPGGKSSDVARKELQEQLVFVLFDLLEVEGRSWREQLYLNRRQALNLLGTMVEGTPIQVAEVVACTWANVQRIWDAGGEGVILKRPDSTYQPGMRSPSWLKVKKEAAAILTIIGFEAGKLGPNSVILLRDADGVKTSVKVLDNATLRMIDANPPSFVGRTLVVKYNERTKDGKYRHIRFDHLK